MNIKSHMRDQAIELRKAGATYREIAEELKVTTGYAYQLANGLKVSQRERLEAENARLLDALKRYGQHSYLFCIRDGRCTCGLDEALGQADKEADNGL